MFYTDTFPNDFMVYRPPKNQILSSSATSVTFYYIGAVSGSGNTLIISFIAGGVSNNDLSYTLSGNSFNTSKDTNIILRLGQGGVPNVASGVTVHYTISIRGKSYTIY